MHLLYFIWLYYRGKRKGDYLELYATPLSEIPIKNITPEEQRPFIEAVDQIIAITSVSGYEASFPPARQKEFEDKVDNLVCDLYGLDEEERKLIFRI